MLISNPNRTGIVTGIISFRKKTMEAEQIKILLRKF